MHSTSIGFEEDIIQCNGTAYVRLGHPLRLGWTQVRVRIGHELRFGHTESMRTCY